MFMKFKISSVYKPAGDQPKAISRLISGLNKNFRHQTLLGVTGSGKTFTIANVIEKTQLPTLVIAHNKTLAAQLCNEFREFFPDNAVEYFVSYYDYYQPEAYLPGSDTYIEKEAMINQEIDRLRHACTQALLSRPDVIVVSSVSAIYSLGSPADYLQAALRLELGQKIKGAFQKEVNLNLDVKVVDLFELQENNFLARESILAEGFSLINNRWLSEIFGFKSAYLFHYDLKNLTASRKKMFYYALKGRRGSKGILDRMKGEQLSDNLIKIPIEFSYEFIELLEGYKIRYKMNKSLFY